jgi:membrane-bound serine protease (ClpP class)
MVRTILRLLRRERCWNAGRRWAAATRLVLAALALALGVMPTVLSHAQQPSTPVLVVHVRDTVDLGLAPYLARVLSEAAELNSPAVIVEINTPGGRLDAALQIREALLGARVRTIAFVNREALSAGALIALAAQDIYVAPGGVIGAATPVDGAGVTADAKTISAVRSIFRATAEQRGRDPLLAEAMVDPSVDVPLAPVGELLTFTAEEARGAGYADGIVPDRQALLDAAGLDDAVVRDLDLSLAEQLVRVLTAPAVAGLLVAIGLLLLLADLLTAGFGVVGVVGIGMLALFFWGHMLAGLAGWEGVALVTVGLLLIAAELLVIPGFGAAGVLGLLALGAGLYVSLVGGQVVTAGDIVRAVSTLAVAAAALAAGAVLLLRYLPRVGRLQGLILQAQVGIPGAAAPAARRPWLGGARLEAHRLAGNGDRPTLLGATGVARSYLRPGGIAEIDGARVDVVTEGEYIPAGTPIEVIADEGYRRVVRRVRAVHGAHREGGEDV